MAKGPLQDVRILDLTHVWAGPLATRILGDLGAQVLKVEAPMGRGPRNYPASPIANFIGGEPGDEPWNNNAAFVKLMRNKKSVAIDLKTETGRKIFLDLVSVSDVVIENFSARAMSGLNLGYDQLELANPKIIHIAMPGYGLSGPYRDRVAFGPTVEPMSGLTSVMGYLENEPRATAMAVPDPTSAVNATAAVVTALFQRSRTGKGQQVEMSLHESAVSYSGPWLIDTQLKNTPKAIGNRHPQIAPHGIYQCDGSDSWVAIGCRSQKEYATLCELADLPTDPAWNLEERITHWAEIDNAISDWTITQDANELSVLLSEHGIPIGAVLDTEGMFQNAQTQAREYFVPLEKDTPIPGNPMKMHSSSSTDWQPCPKLGQNNHEILSDWLNYSDAGIRALYKAGIICDKPPR